MNTTLSRLDLLERRVAELERRTAELEGQLAELKGRPAPPTFPGGPKLPNSVQSGCSKCGMVFSGPMGYVCPHVDCPTGLGPVICGVTGTAGRS